MIISYLFEILLCYEVKFLCWWTFCCLGSLFVLRQVAMIVTCILGFRLLGCCSFMNERL